MIVKLMNLIKTILKLYCLVALSAFGNSYNAETVKLKAAKIQLINTLINSQKTDVSADVLEVIAKQSQASGESFSFSTSPDSLHVAFSNNDEKTTPVQPGFVSAEGNIDVRRLFLKGGLVNFETGKVKAKSIEFEDVHDYRKARSFGIGLDGLQNLTNTSPIARPELNGSVEPSYSRSDFRATNRATVSEGTAVETESDISGLNRDASQSRVVTRDDASEFLFYSPLQVRGATREARQEIMMCHIDKTCQDMKHIHPEEATLLQVLKQEIHEKYESDKCEKEIIAEAQQSISEYNEKKAAMRIARSQTLAARGKASIGGMDLIDSINELLKDQLEDSTDKEKSDDKKPSKKTKKAKSKDVQDLEDSLSKQPKRAPKDTKKETPEPEGLHDNHSQSDQNQEFNHGPVDQKHDDNAEQSTYINFSVGDDFFDGNDPNTDQESEKNTGISVLKGSEYTQEAQDKIDQARAQVTDQEVADFKQKLIIKRAEKLGIDPKDVRIDGDVSASLKSLIAVEKAYGYAMSAASVYCLSMGVYAAFAGAESVPGLQAAGVAILTIGGKWLLDETKKRTLKTTFNKMTQFILESPTFKDKSQRFCTELENSRESNRLSYAAMAIKACDAGLFGEDAVNHLPSYEAATYLLKSTLDSCAHRAARRFFGGLNSVQGEAINRLKKAFKGGSNNATMGKRQPAMAGAGGNGGGASSGDGGSGRFNWQNLRNETGSGGTRKSGGASGSWSKSGGSASESGKSSSVPKVGGRADDLPAPKPRRQARRSGGSERGSNSSTSQSEPNAWNQYQSTTKGQHSSRTEAASGWKQHNKEKGIDTPKPSVSKSGTGTKSASETSGSGLLPGEGNVGTYGELKKEKITMGKGQNLSAHHMPSASYMKNHGIERKSGVSMMMEEPNPGSGGRHRKTRTYGRAPNNTETPRDALARDVMDARKIYKDEGLYNDNIRDSLQKVVKKNKEMHAPLFNKEKQ
jgi:hypothetical protein